MTIHIHAPKGYYLGQVRRTWQRSWRTVTGEMAEAKTAMSIAVLKMEKDDNRARVIFLTPYYDPNVVMECSK